MINLALPRFKLFVMFQQESMKYMQKENGCGIVKTDSSSWSTKFFTPNGDNF
jgi:hypothetical protein